MLFLHNIKLLYLKMQGKSCFPWYVPLNPGAKMEKCKHAIWLNVHYISKHSQSQKKKKKKSIIVESLRRMLLGMFTHSLVDLLAHSIIY